MRFSFNYLGSSLNKRSFKPFIKTKITMRKYHLPLILTVFFTFSVFSSVSAQTILSKKLNWYSYEILNPDQINTIKLESFDGAIFDYRYKNLSFYTERIKGSFHSVEIFDAQYEKLSQVLTQEQKDSITNQAKVYSALAYDRKVVHTNIKILPYRIGPNGTVEKLVSFQLKMKPLSVKSASNTSRVYANHSVLKSGEWFKMGISSSGMYKISYDDLSKLGIYVDQLNPKNLRIYGNGGGITPEANYISRYDDLQENAIQVIGEEDGKFNSGDYILFYARGPHEKTVDINNNIIQNTTNPYSNESFYFLNFDIGPGKRMSTQSNDQNTPTQIINDYNYFTYHEKNYSTGLNTTIKSGRERYGEEFNNQITYDFNFNIPDVVTNKPTKIRVDLLGRVQYPNTSSFAVKANDQNVSSMVCEGVKFSYEWPYGNTVTTGNLSIPTSENINLNIKYLRPDISAIGYLNFIWVNAYRKLNMVGNQLNFINISTYGAGKISQYNLTTINPSNTIVLDVTDKIEPKIQTTVINGNNLVFTLDGSLLREFHSYSGSEFSTPRMLGKIENQDLHALGQYDFIIITHPEFKQEAERLAEFRKTNNNLRTLVVLPSHIYNEFGSGAQDASAIRDFIKMFYDRAGNNTSEMPKYLLMFGDGSYDNLDIIKSNSNYVVTFESRNSIAPFGSYVSDDFFGFLDDVEGDWDYNPSADYGATALDVAVGRLPVRNSLQAKQMVDKIIHYSNTETFGDWRNKYVLIADDQDNNIHQEDAEFHANTIKKRNKDFNVDKIYLDSYQQMSTPSGNRYPEVNAAFNQRVNTGALVINFIGHGGENGLAHEKILTIEDINSWKGLDNMPVLLTATCSFSRWDDPAFQSAGELALLNPNGGAIALFTTTRIVYANENKTINDAFVRALFDSTNAGGTNTLGDIFRTSKNYNGIGVEINQRNFTLLGDPSLPFATPKYKVVTESINNKAIDTANADTIKALSTIQIKGFIADKNGNLLSNYNGVVYPAIYDKRTIQKTLAQDKGVGGSKVMSYEVQKSIIYKGKASVQNGRFTFSFVVPKDISYNIGYGRISYYAQLGSADAHGSYDSVMVGGSSNSVLNDTQGPEMTIFLNDENFAPGGITGENPLLIVKVNDQHGVNTVGNGIGHNITATLTSENETQKIDLNEYYESKLDSYQEGEIQYPLTKLTPGNYKLSVKAWDVLNNSSEKTTEFTVLDSKEFSIDRVYNYPNPFTTTTGFQFEHNRPGDQLDVMVQIFTVSGKLVKTIQQNIPVAGSRVSNIGWDAKDEYGDKLARGVYVYRMKVKSSDGTIADKYQKLVILN